MPCVNMTSVNLAFLFLNVLLLCGQSCIIVILKILKKGCDFYGYKNRELVCKNRA